MKKTKTRIIILLILAAATIESSCSSQGVPLSSLTEKEIHDLGTIGIAAEIAELDAVHTQGPSEFSYRFREMRDHTVDIAGGAYEGGKKGARLGEPFRFSVLLSLALATVGMTIGAIAGGIHGALNRETYSDAPDQVPPNKTAYHAVQKAIDDLGLPAKLRDRLWDRIEAYPHYRFELVRQLPPDPRQRNDLGPRTEWARYWPLRDQGIQTVLKVRIPFIEFRGSRFDQPYRLVIPVETTLFHTATRACVRQILWEYQGGRHHVDEWNANGAQLFSEELNRFFDHVARRIPLTFFGKERTPFPEEVTTVIPKKESLACLG